MENKIRANGLNKGEYLPFLDRFHRYRTPEEIKKFEEDEKKVLRHKYISNNNIVGVAKTEKEVDEVMTYVKRHPNALYETVVKKFPNIFWLCRTFNTKTKKERKTCPNLKTYIV